MRIFSADTSRHERSYCTDKHLPYLERLATLRRNDTTEKNMPLTSLVHKFIVGMFSDPVLLFALVIVVFILLGEHS